jgi:IclR family pca regulon transcriptional regulator
MQVLETLASLPARGSLPELIKRTELDRATVYRLLRSLLDSGYVERTGRGEYAVSTRGFLLGVHLTQSHNLVRIAQPALSALRYQINETVNLAVLSGPEVVYLVRLSVGRILSLNIDVGSRLPAYCASLGKAILAFLPEAEAISILRLSDRQAFTIHTKTSIEGLVAELAQTRRRGYAVNNQEFEVGLCSMACPIFAGDRRAVAAVNIAVSAARMSAAELVRRYRQQLQATCAQISKSLGGEVSIAVSKVLPPAKRGGSA